METTNSYYSYLVENNPEKVQYFDWIKNELDTRVYYYGQHFKSPYENKPLKQRAIKKVLPLMKRLSESANLAVSGYNNCILSEAYFSIGKIVADNLNENVFSFPWNNRVGKFSVKDISETICKLSEATYEELLSDNFYARVNSLFGAIKQFLKDNSVKLVIFPNDLIAINRIAIDACKEVGIKTAIYIHGLPSYYNDIDDNRADYLCVWGDGIKENFIKAGVDPNKIIVTGHPAYSKIQFKECRTVDLSSPLVLSRAVCGAPSISDFIRISDRGISVDYPWTVEKVLKDLGVKKAVLRLHPSENPHWYRHYIDNTFYKIDSSPLSESLDKASIVIGPTSTVSMDASIKGVPFFGFTPPMMYSYPIVPPFDNSEPDFPIALNTKDLKENLVNGRCLKSSVFEKYISPVFDMSLLIDRIK